MSSYITKITPTLQYTAILQIERVHLILHSVITKIFLQNNFFETLSSSLPAVNNLEFYWSINSTIEFSTMLLTCNFKESVPLILLNEYIPLKQFWLGLHSSSLFSRLN